MKRVFYRQLQLRLHCLEYFIHAPSELKAMPLYRANSSLSAVSAMSYMVYVYLFLSLEEVLVNVMCNQLLLCMASIEGSRKYATSVVGSKTKSSYVV